jgi:hypothetical protein
MGNILMDIADIAFPQCCTSAGLLACKYVGHGFRESLPIHPSFTHALTGTL